MYFLRTPDVVQGKDGKVLQAEMTSQKFSLE